MILAVLVFFIAVSILLYVLLGGADYGAGVLESIKGSRRRADQQELINQVIGPVWEANHMWLILVVVILFTAFPRVYTSISIYLHLPVVALLLGIIARGCAFAFRHYDAIKDRSQQYYTAIFALSSIWTSIWLGVIAGALLQGRIAPSATTYYELYIAPWFNLFCFSLGLFTTALFSFLAAIYLTGETRDEELQGIFLKRAIVANALAVVLGGLVFVTGTWGNDLALASRFFENPYCVLSAIVATLLLPTFYSKRVQQRKWVLRCCAGVQVSCILLGWYVLEYPYLLRTQDASLTFLELAAPHATQVQLLIALLVGSCLIFPALGFLYTVMDRS